MLHEISVYDYRVLGGHMLKNITLSAEETMIEKARRRAVQESKTLNALFREWLGRYLAQEKASSRYEQLMRGLKKVNSGRRFSREEMNER